MIRTSIKILATLLIMLGIIQGINSILAPASSMDCAIGILISLICLIVGTVALEEIRKEERK